MRKRCPRRCSWFHGKMRREDAEQLLEPREDGLFLVRESNNYPGDYTLCVCSEGKVEHYHIIYKDNKLTIDEEEFFENLNQLVEVFLSLNGEKVNFCWGAPSFADLLFSCIKSMVVHISSRL